MKFISSGGNSSIARQFITDFFKVNCSLSSKSIVYGKNKQLTTILYFILKIFRFLDWFYDFDLIFSYTVVGDFINIIKTTFNFNFELYSAFKQHGYTKT